MPDEARGEGAPLLAYFGHHKCATQWMKSIVAEVCSVVGRTQVVFSDAKAFDKDLARALPHPGSTFLCYMSADQRYLKDLGPMRGFHVIRDPRDVVVSAYFSHRYSHPLFGDLEDYRQRLNEVSESEGLLLEMERRRHQFKAMRDWDYDRPDLLELRMEDLTADAATLVPTITSFLGLGADDGLTDEVLQRIVAQRDFARLAGRPPGEEDVTSHFRKGVAGDWVNHFGPEHIEAFDERYGDLLVHLGYEDAGSTAAAVR